MFHVGNCTCNGMAVNDGSPLPIELCKGPSLPSCSCTSDQCQVGMKQHLLLRIVVILWCKLTAKPSTRVWRSVTHTQTYSMCDVLQCVFYAVLGAIWWTLTRCGSCWQCCVQLQSCREFYHSPTVRMHSWAPHALIGWWMRLIELYYIELYTYYHSMLCMQVE